jgi:hypothetical protein
MKIPRKLRTVMARVLSVTFLLVAIILIATYSLFSYLTGLSRSKVEALTDIWIKEVTLNHDPAAIQALFCSDGNLVGTVSQVKRMGNDIGRYFDYFAKLDGIEVVSRKYNISRVTNDVYVNTAFITWNWDALDAPITARMTFIYRGNCIFQLHSSALPDLNQDLKDISGMS